MLEHSWRIELMSELRLSRGECVVTHFKSRKVAGLAAYLAFYLSRHHNREELQTLLWPDDALDAARNSLRVALSLLRRQLEPDGIPAGSVLYADKSSVWLNRDSVTVDTIDFDAMYAAALHTEDESKQPALLKRVIDAYKGDLLPGLYDDWVLAERARLNESYLQALRKLVRALAANRDYEIALEYARSAVRIDPLREEAARDLMRLFVAVHQPTAALLHYKELEQRLLTEFQSRPNAATRELARRIVDGLDRVSGDPPSTQAPETAASTPPPQHAPASKSASFTSHNRIPSPLTRFFGRQHEMAKLREWAGENLEEVYTNSSDDAPRLSRTRLLTLTGPGGIGKSRLTMQIAEELNTRLNDKVWFVPLADLTDPNHIAGAIADALGVMGSDRSGLPARIAAKLSGEPSILILDNFEHLLEGGAPLVRMLLEQNPALAIMLTSRRALGLPGEQEFPVSALRIPMLLQPDKPAMPGPLRSTQPAVMAFAQQHPSSATLSSLADCAAVQLFVDRAQAVEPGFCLAANNANSVSALCRQLEGHPLALELAAARIRVLTPDQMLAYVGRRLDLLVDPNADKDGRHRSLRAAIEWSYRLLYPEERRLFVRLSVFEGGCTLDAAKYVCDDPEILEALEQLKMSSLIQTETTGETQRFRMMETLRSFATEQLSAAELSHLRPRHAEYYLALAEGTDPNVKGPDEAKWMDLLQLEHDNIRAALNYFRSDPDGGLAGLRLVCALWRFWIGRGNLTEARERFDAALAHTDAGEPTLYRARALMYSGDLASSQGDFAAAETLFEGSLEAFRTTGNALGGANSLSRLGLVKMRSGDYVRSRQLQEESLEMFETLNDMEGVATSSSYLGLLSTHEGDYLQARNCNERCLVIYRALGNRRNLAMTLGNLGLIAEHLEEHTTARGLQEESLEIHRELGTQQGEAAALSNLSVILIKLGERDTGIERLLEGMSLFRKLGSKHNVIISLETLAGVAIIDEQFRRAAWLYGAAEVAREVLGAALPPRDNEARERDLSLLRERLGEQSFYLELTKGRATNLDKAMDFALSRSVH